nr:hypothetical protein [uncultured Acetatifactor sp.]
MKKGNVAVMTGCILAFYVGIIMFIYFPVLHINEADNFKAAMTFEVIGLLALFLLIIGNIVLPHVKTGYFVPLIMVTAAYTIIRNIITMVFVGFMPSVVFILLNLILLFLYCLLSIPMYMMGKK